MAKSNGQSAAELSLYDHFKYGGRPPWSNIWLLVDFDHFGTLEQNRAEIKFGSSVAK